MCLFILNNDKKKFFNEPLMLVFIYLFICLQDKTFGLKNKKGAKNQKFIQQVQHQVKTGNQSARKVLYVLISI